VIGDDMMFLSYFASADKLHHTFEMHTAHHTN